MVDFGAALEIVSQKFCVMELNDYQREAIFHFVDKKTDVFVNLPTGFGKSLIYQALPVVFNTMLREGHVVVISPLVNLMKDQVDKLRKLRISAITLSDFNDKDVKAVEMGSFSIGYGSPEAFLKIECWRKMLSSDIYRKRLCAIAVNEAHVIKQWRVKDIRHTVSNL